MLLYASTVTTAITACTASIAIMLLLLLLKYYCHHTTMPLLYYYHYILSYVFSIHLYNECFKMIRRLYYTTVTTLTTMPLLLRKITRFVLVIVLVFHCKFMSVVHCFRFNEPLLFTGNFWMQILKGWPDCIFMFNWHFPSICNCSIVFRLFSNDWAFPTGRKFRVKWPPKRKNREKACWEGTPSNQTVYFEPCALALSLCLCRCAR